MQGSELIVGTWAAEPQQTQEMALSGVEDPEGWLVDAWGGPETWSGIRVSGHTVLTSGPVYQAVTIISSTLASLPITVQKEVDGQNVPKKTHPAYRIWNVVGNEEMLPYHTRQTLLAWGLIHGNGIGAIHYQAGRPVGVYPLCPGSVYLDRDDEGQLLYVWTEEGRKQVLFPHEVFHFKMMGNGLWGLSPLGLFHNTFGNGLAIEKFQGKHFANSARPAGVLQSEKVLKPEARNNLRREWDQVHQGLDNTSKVAVLWDGITWAPMSVTNEQAQMLESRKFYREEVASIYNLPPHMLGAMENSAVRANIEEQNRAFVRNALIPHDRAFCEESQRKLCSHHEQVTDSIDIKHNFKALLRGDLQSRYSAYSTGRQWGWLSANDVLRLEDMDEIGTQGDTYLVPSNMADAETGEPFASSSEPAPAPPQIEEQPADEQTDQGFVAFADQQLRKAQSVEVQNLRKAITGKRPYKAVKDKYYSSFSSYMAESIENLGNISGFVGKQQIKSAVDQYAVESMKLVESVTDENELLSIVEDWPERITTLVESIQCQT